LCVCVCGFVVVEVIVDVCGDVLWELE
jgi:hypothetical protein